MTGAFIYKEPVPINLLMLHKVSTLATGSNHIVFVCEKTSMVFSVGDNSKGQLVNKKRFPHFQLLVHLVL